MCGGGNWRRSLKPLIAQINTRVFSERRRRKRGCLGVTRKGKYTHIYICMKLVISAMLKCWAGKKEKVLAVTDRFPLKWSWCCRRFCGSNYSRAHRRTLYCPHAEAAIWYRRREEEREGRYELAEKKYLIVISFWSFGSWSWEMFLWRCNSKSHQVYIHVFTDTFNIRLTFKNYICISDCGVTVSSICNVDGHFKVEKEWHHRHSPSSTFASLFYFLLDLLISYA